jgi:hypothetical protein
LASRPARAGCAIEEHLASVHDVEISVSHALGYTPIPKLDVAKLESDILATITTRLQRENDLKVSKSGSHHLYVMLSHAWGVPWDAPRPGEVALRVSLELTERAHLESECKAKNEATCPWRWVTTWSTDSLMLTALSDVPDAILRSVRREVDWFVEAVHAARP